MFPDLDSLEIDLFLRHLNTSIRTLAMHFNVKHLSILLFSSG